MAIFIHLSPRVPASSQDLSAHLGVLTFLDYKSSLWGLCPQERGGKSGCNLGVRLRALHPSPTGLPPGLETPGPSLGLSFLI
jgi:hypothetical protein